MVCVHHGVRRWPCYVHCLRPDIFALEQQADCLDAVSTAWMRSVCIMVWDSAPAVRTGMSCAAIPAART